LKFDGNPFQKSLRKAADHFQWHADEIFSIQLSGITGAPLYPHAGYI
jgi:hypothetical protein